MARFLSLPAMHRIAVEDDTSSGRCAGSFQSPGSPDDTWHLVEAFRRGLHEAGFVEGQNGTIEYRWALGEQERLAGLASDLVRKPVTVLVTTGGESAALAAKAATSTIPIAFNHRRRSGQAWACGDLQSARRKRHGDKYFDLHSGTQTARTIARAGAADIDDRRVFGPKLPAL
jgi:hypothetical protein